MDTNLPFDIYGLVPYVDYLKIFLLAVLVLCVIVALWYLVRYLVAKFKRTKSVVSSKSVLELLDELILKLKNETPCEDEGAFYEKITMLFREGLELGLGFSATSMTVVEIRKYIMESLFDDKDKIEIMQFFKIADLVKFSSQTTQEQDRSRYLTQVIGWLTKVKVEVEKKIKEEEERKKQAEAENKTRSVGVEDDETVRSRDFSSPGLDKRGN